MKRKLFTTLLLTCCIAFCIAAIDPSGKWKGVLKTDDGNDYPVAYTFKADGDKLSGNVITPVGDLPIADGKIKGDSIYFNVEFNGGDIPNNGKCYADSIAINAVVGGTVYHTILSRDT